MDVDQLSFSKAAAFVKHGMIFFFNLAWSWCVHNRLPAKVESFPRGVTGPKAEIMVACKFVYEMFFMNYGSGLFSHAGFALYQYHSGSLIDQKVVYI